MGGDAINYFTFLYMSWYNTEQNHDTGEKMKVF